MAYESPLFCPLCAYSTFADDKMLEHLQDHQRMLARFITSLKERNNAAK